MSETAILSLAQGKDVLTEKNDIIWYLIAFSLQNPGETSSSIENEMVSFRTLNGKYGNNREELAVQYEAALQAAIVRHLPEENVSVFVTSEDIEGTATYRLTVSVKTSSGFVLNRAPITIDGDNIDVNFNR